MLLAIDVQYSENTAFVAGVEFEGWYSESPADEFVSILNRRERVVGAIF